MLQDIMPGTEELLNKEMVSGYIGFDPTADSLGVGNLVQVMTLLHFQQCGHKPFALVGGATGMVGDPSGKSDERNLLSEEILHHNLACQKQQLEKFLDFSNAANGAEIVNNYDWFKGVSFLDFIRDVGKHITINYMMAKDSVKSRFETGMSFTEFSYQLVQGYDFYYLRKHHGVKLQMGGSDQWGNIVTGTELIRRKDGKEAFALTTPLIKKADGTKFGKTESGNVWLDAKRTSPYKFYQFWLNASDEDSKNYIRIFTLMGREEIEALEKQHDAAPHLRLLQKALAKEVTIRVHSRGEYDDSVRRSEKLFSGGIVDEIKGASNEEVEGMFDSDAIAEIKLTDIKSGVPSVDFLSAATGSVIYSSKGEAKRNITAGAVKLNEIKIGLDKTITEEDLLNGHYILVQTGKKIFKLIKAVQ